MNKLLRYGIFWIAFVWGMGALAPRAQAQQTQKMAKVHYESGKAYYQQGKYTAAIREFTTALELSKKPVLYYNIALCWERLGDIEKAIAFREKYLEALPKAADADQVKLQIASLKKRLSGTSVVLKGGPAAALVTVDGKTRGALPLSGPVSLRPGSHKIVVKKEGYSTFRSTVAVSAGQSVTVDVEMQREEPRPAPRGGDNGDPGDSGGGAEGKDPVVKKKVTTKALVGGLAMGLVANDAVDTANKKLKAGDLAAYDTNKKNAKNYAIGADVMYAVGGALVVTGIVLFFLEGRGAEKPSDKKAIIVPSITPNGVGLTAAGRF